jgi:sulfhydrogenase subunit beta (sulfur reductase)
VAFIALDTNNLKNLVAAMAKQAKVRGPLRTAQGVELADVSAKSDLVLEYGNFKLPLKREFFPQCEVISRYDREGQKEVMPEDGSVIVFGVRPCDTQSLAHLDKVFGDAPAIDPNYKKRRDAALVISMACASPADTCFCTSTGGNPSATAGTDIISFTVGKALLFEGVTKKGEAFLKKNAKLFRAPTPKELQKKEQQESDALARIASVDVTNAPGALANKNDAAFWNEIAETCLSCGACTYLCPTCHCFDFSDEQQGDGGVRLRVHDACMFATFTKEASGHNPRGQKRDRMRQRIMHKFSYAPENFGEVFCVGCGRCIVNCPSNIDIRETISKVNA